MRTIRAKRRPVQKTEKFTVLQHLTELKNRLSISFLSIFLFSIIGYLLQKQILELLTAPIQMPLYYTSPTAGLETILNISLLFGVICSLPILLYQVCRFVHPDLKIGSNMCVYRFTLCSLLLGGIGITVCYLLILPPSLHFMQQFGGPSLLPLFSAREYFSFIIRFLLSFSVIFQLPLILHLLNKIKPLTVHSLMRRFGHVVLASFIVSALLTPTPDIFNQSIVAFPILLIYLISIVSVWISNSKFIVCISRK